MVDYFILHKYYVFFDSPVDLFHAPLLPQFLVLTRLFFFSQVGDGLEIYVVLAKNSNSLQGLQTIRDIQEVTSTSDGERTFVIRRELKKD